jgi:hypothetical protein
VFWFPEATATARPVETIFPGFSPSGTYLSGIIFFCIFLSFLSGSTALIYRPEKGRLWHKYYSILIISKRGICETNITLFQLSRKTGFETGINLKLSTVLY